jgi:hypothetical protein
MEKQASEYFRTMWRKERYKYRILNVDTPSLSWQ